ncbi:YbbR domain-containing protein [Lewinella marina]|nr:YbbR domain-containing protein [Neolewinella marina]
MAATDRQILLICIGLAFVFWLILNLSQDYEITKNVQLHYTVSADRALAGSPPRSIPVQIRGRGWNLIWESMRGGEMNVELDVGADEDYLLSRNVLEQQIRRQLTSGDLEIDNIGYDPQRILTTPRDGKRVPVVSNVKASFGPGYAAVNGVSLSPDSVTVSGAIDDLEEITSWPTQTLVLENLEESVRAEVQLEPAPEGLDLNYDKVDLSVDVEAFIEQQFRIPVTLYNAPPSDSSRVFPPFVTVTATVPQRAFGTIRASDFRVEADLSRMKTNDPYNTVPLSLTRVPENISQVEFSPRAVEFYIYNRPGS